MFEIIEEKATTILRPTGINLAPWVINPYQGCQRGCFFCYAQFNQSALKTKRPWGSYVKVKINAAEVLRREIGRIRPQKVLLGSTTEIFQSLEEKYKITESILRLLNKEKIKYVLMSRSPAIENHLELLSGGCCEAVYFTVDTFPWPFGEQLQPQKSIAVINRLCARGIKTIAYFCPVMPWLFEAEELLSHISRMTKHVEFEFLNFKLAPVEKLMAELRNKYPQFFADYNRLMKDKDFYEKTIAAQKILIDNAAKKYEKEIKIHEHGFGAYFGNRY